MAMEIVLMVQMIVTWVFIEMSGKSSFILQSRNKMDAKSSTVQSNQTKTKWRRASIGANSCHRNN